MCVTSGKPEQISIEYMLGAREAERRSRQLGIIIKLWHQIVGEFIMSEIVEYQANCSMTFIAVSVGIYLDNGEICTSNVLGWPQCTNSR